MPNPRSRSVWALLALSTLACRQQIPPPGHRMVVDLTELLATAEVRREDRGIDFGTSEARSRLEGGWSWDETSGDGTPFQWTIGAESGVRFLLVSPRDLTLELVGWAVPGAAEREVEVELNGSALSPLHIPARRGVHRIEVPRERVRAGENVLVFRHPWAVAGETGEDPRRLAVAWESLRIRPSIPGDLSPSVHDDGGAARLRLPFGTEVGFYLSVPAGSRLVWGGLAASRSGRLGVEVQLEGAAPRAAAELPPDEGSGSVALRARDEGPGLVRVTLRAVPGSVSAGEGALEIETPAVWAPAISEAASPQSVERPVPQDSDAPSGRPNVLLYLVDTLRADRVGTYGGGTVTPAIDAFAADGVVFEDVIAQSSWTRPSVATLFTGRHPRAHGVTTLADRLPEEATSLAELLREAGYRTAAFSANAHVTESTGLAQGFDEFSWSATVQRSDELGREGVRWIDHHLSAPGRSAPFFLYLHTIDPHATYEPPAPYRLRFAPGAPPEAGSRPHLERIFAASGERRKRLLAPIPGLYTGEVAAADASFGSLLAELRNRGLLDETLVVFLSDHGEEFDEHGAFGHGANLHHETTAIPWILRLPAASGASPRRIAGAAQQIDLLPTVLGALGLEVPPGLPGIDLLGVDGAVPAERPAFSHLDYDGRRGISVVLGDWKLIEPLSRAFAPAPALYHRSRDPHEERNLAEANPVRRGYLQTLVRRHLLEVEASSGAPVAMDEETRRGLEALGYL